MNDGLDKINQEKIKSFYGINSIKEMVLDKKLSYELGFLKAYIYYEKAYIEIFKLYVTGKGQKKISNTKLFPNLKRETSDEIININILDFKNLEHFESLMRVTGKTFIDYDLLIKEKGNFLLSPNPYKSILENTDYSSSLNKMKSVRNFIAHRSVTAKENYIKKCFSGDKTKFKDVEAYLKEKHDGTLSESYRTNFSFYCDCMENIIDSLIACKPHTI